MYYTVVGTVPYTAVCAACYPVFNVPCTWCVLYHIMVNICVIQEPVRELLTQPHRESCRTGAGMRGVLITGLGVKRGIIKCYL